MKQALIFPGQGAQYVGMGKDFYDNYKECKEIFDQADDALSMHLSKLIFEGPAEDLTQTSHSQLAIYVMSMAIKQLIDVRPDTCAGLSLGEYSAVVASGRLSFEDGLKLVQARGQFMQEACVQNPGTMAVVLGLPEALVDGIIHDMQGKHKVWVANLNCPRQVVLAGTKEGIAAAGPIMKEKGAKRYMELDVSGAFHSELMKPAQDKLEPVVDAAPFSESNVGLVMNVPGNYVASLDEVRHFLKEQVVHPVKWEKGVHAMDAHGIERYIEIGPGKTLAGMNRKIGVKGSTISIEKVGDLDAIT